MNKSVTSLLCVLLISACAHHPKRKISNSASEEFSIGSYPFGVESHSVPEFFKYSAKELAEKMRNRELTSEEVVRGYIQQTELRNKEINAVVLLDKEGAIARAKEADIATENGISWGPLHGVPVTIKDTFLTKGMRTTSGIEALKNYTPDHDATSVALLREAGAIILSKTNTPPMAMDMQTYNNLFGRTNNPWNVERTVGGSTGGGAAALASGMIPFALGSDLSGSIRQPSAYNGVFGLKPTLGVVSLKGHVPPLPKEIDGMKTLAVVGVMSRSIDDLEFSLNILTKTHNSDRNTRVLKANDPTIVSVSQLKVAWVNELANVAVDDEVKEKIQSVAMRLEENGAIVTNTSPANFDYNGVWETWGALVGLQTGYDNANYKRWIANQMVKSPVPMHKRIMDTISVPKYMEELAKQEGFTNQIENFLNDYDVWICPVGSTNAFTHQTPTKEFMGFRLYDRPLKVNGKDVHYYMNNQAYTSIFNVTGHPVVVIPVGLDRDGLPIGIQLVGRKNEDYKLIKAARAIYESLQNIQPIQDQE